VLAFINLALALGKVGRPYCGYGCFTGQGNGQGGREHGQKADQLPGYRKLDNPEHRAYIAKIWGVDEKDLPMPGASAYEMLDRMGDSDGLRALLVFGSNLSVSAPRASHVQARLDALDFLVVSDFFLSETAERADVVLPTAQWAEEDGTMTNLEGRVLFRGRATEPPPSVRTDLQIIAALAQGLGVKSGFSSVPRDVFAELRIASAGGVADYAGITYERIQREDGVFWPCPSEDHPGTPRLFLERWARAFPPRRVQRRRRTARSRLSSVSHNRAHHGAISVRHANAPREETARPRAAGVRADPSINGAPLWNRRRRPGSIDHAPRQGARRRAIDHHHSHGHRVYAVSLRGAGKGESAHQPGA
jgi:predicted molibdopterin-dependent oxidoreductase YjgC